MSDVEFFKELKLKMEKRFDLKRLKDGRTREGQAYKINNIMLELLEEHRKADVFLECIPDDIYDLYLQIHEKTGNDIFIIYTT